MLRRTLLGASPAYSIPLQRGCSGYCRRTPRSLHAAATPKEATLTFSEDYYAEDDLPDGSPVGPAFAATLNMLEWDKICASVSQFASTHIGKKRCQALQIPPTQAASEQLLAETGAAMTLEGDFAVSLDFGGISTEEADRAITRADKGGMVTGPQLRSVVFLIAGERWGSEQLQHSAFLGASYRSTSDSWCSIMSVHGNYAMTLPRILAR